MSRDSKARGKTFRAAATKLADQWGYTGIERDEVIATTIGDRTGDWKVIWDRALKHVGKAVQASAIRSGMDLASMESSIAARDEILAERTADINRLTMRNREQEATIRALMTSNQKLQEELSRLKVDLVQRSTLHTRTLELELSKVRAELEETKKHTTTATWKVFEENERLVAEVRNVENDLALAEDEVIDERLRRQEAEKERGRQADLVESLRSALNASMAKRDELLTRALAAEGALAARPKRAEPRIPKKPEGEGWNLSWVKMTGVTITGTVTPEPTPLVRCMAASSKHACELMTQPGKEHSPVHRCHCGMLWG